MATNLNKLVRQRYLLCLNTAILPKKSEITKDNFVIGSKSDADLVVPGKSVEGDHAIVRITGNYCYIHMLSRDSILLVNNDVLVFDERRSLRSQDTVCFGDVRYRYVEGIIPTR